MAFTPAHEIPRIVSRLRRAYRGGLTRPLRWRQDQLRALLAMLRNEEARLVEALHADLGKSGFEGWLGEVKLLENEVLHTLEHLSTWIEPERVATPFVLKPGQSWIYREPLGVALIIAPWNYPLQLVLAPLIGALAAGNAAVVKPSEIAQATAELLENLLAKFLDPQAVAVVQGGVPETTSLLAEKFDHIFYTGNAQVARVVMAAAAQHLTPVTLELGGKSPCLVDREVDLEVALRRIVWGKFINAGQTCVAPDYLLVHQDRTSQVLEGLARTIKQFYGEDPRRSPDYARIVNQRHVDRLAAFLDDGDKVCGGQVDREERYIAPTVLRNLKPGARVMEEEIFGPVLPVIPVASIDEGIDFLNDRPKPLSLYLFSESEAVHQRVLDRVSFGGGCLNDTCAHLGVPELPFGGVGASGMGAYHGRFGFETFSHRKGVLHKSTWIDPNLRYPPYDARKMKWLRRLA